MLFLSSRFMPLSLLSMPRRSVTPCWKAIRSYSDAGACRRISHTSSSAGASSFESLCPTVHAGRPQGIPPGQGQDCSTPLPRDGASWGQDQGAEPAWVPGQFPGPGALRLSMGAGASEGFLREVGVTTAAGLHRALTAGSGNCCSRWGRKAGDTLEVGHLPTKTWKPTGPPLRPSGPPPALTRPISPCLFLLSPGRWTSGEPKAQKLALVLGVPGLSDYQPHPSVTNHGKDRYAVPPAPWGPKAPDPSAYSLGHSSMGGGNAGSRRERKRTQRT